MNIDGVKIHHDKMDKIKNTEKPLNVRTLWEKIKNWFGFGKEEIVFPLIKETFFDNKINDFEKIKGFCKLRNLTGDAYKENFRIEKKDNEIDFSILLDGNFDGEKISFIHNINEDVSDEIKFIADMILSLKKNGFDDLLFYAIDKAIELKKKGIERNEIKKEVIRELIIDNKSRFIGDKDLDRDYISKNQLYKKAKFDPELFTDRFKELIKNEKESIEENIEKSIKEGITPTYMTLLEKIEGELFRDLSRMKININSTPIADMKNKPQDLDEIKFKDLEFEKLKKEFKNLDENDKELVYSLLYQKVILEFKSFLMEEDLFAGLVNVLYSGKTTANIIKDDSKNKITIVIENKKALQDKNAKGVENIDYVIDTKLAYVNEKHYNLVNLVSEELAEKPFSISKLDPNLSEILSVGTNITLGDHTKLIFEYDTKNKTLALDNKSKYEYVILKD
ncbi:hypothetical protein ACBQ20_02060 [Proteus vulgaris]|uniref:hypothetical protein n=1 Tax=Proteus vulgaris TaxID=585 RepID=UPI003524D15B